MSSNALQNPTESAPVIERGGYRFPPGFKTNLMWRAVKRLAFPDPTRLFQRLVAEYGDVSHYKVGFDHILFLNQPEYIREVLIVQHANFIKERTQYRAKLLLGNGMITADGQPHRRQRQVAQPSFHRQRVPGYAREVVNRAAELRERWRPGETDIYREMMQYTLGVVSKTLFSRELGEEIGPLNRAMGDIMSVYNPIVLLPGVKALLRIPGTPLRKFVHARARFDETVYRLIDEHRLRAGSDGEDLLSALLLAQDEMGWSEEDLRDQVLTVFLAGYETVAIALTWTWYLLSQHPGVERRFHAEIDEVLGRRLPTYDDLPRLKYAEMVMAESMRLYPPAWAMGRQALEEFELGPYRLPKGTTVLMSQFITHRDEKYFPEPMKFDPERFTPEAKAARQRFTYFPFGMGPRQCIGEAFAWMEGVLALATFGQRWKMRHIDGHKVEPQPLFTLRPKYGMKMKLEGR